MQPTLITGMARTIESPIITRMAKDVAGVLARASTQLEAGSTTTARHLLAKAGRQTVTLLDRPLTPMLNGNRRAVLDGVLTRIQSAHGALQVGDTALAAKRLGTARFGIDLLLPG